jgi:hypothetical protein
MKFAASQIAKTQMHHLGGWRTKHNPIRKIRIFADNYQITLAGKVPDF